MASFRSPNFDPLSLSDFLSDAGYLLQSTDASGTLIYANDVWISTLGYDPARLDEGLNVFDLIAPGSLDHCRNEFGRVLEGGSARVEAEFTARDGRSVWLAGWSAGHVDAEGRLTTRGVFHDVTTERERRERERLLEERYAAVLDVLREGVAVFDDEGRIRFVNDSATRIMGVPAEAMVGHALLEFDWRTIDLMGDEVARKDHPVLVALRTGEPQIDRVVGLLWPGVTEPVWIAVSARPLTDAGGAVASFRDISDQVRAQRELRQSEERFRRLVEESPEAIIIHVDGRIVFSNEAGAELLGVASAAELEGRSVTEFMTPEARPISVARFERVRRGERADRIEQPLRRADGRVVDIEVSSSPTTFKGQDAIQSLARDITDRKRAERLKDELIGLVSHELRNPLGAIRGALAQLERRLPDLPAMERRFLEMAARNSELLLRMLNDLLDIERLEDGMALDWQTVDAGALLYAARDIMAVPAQAARVTLDVDAASVSFVADRDRLIQVLVNLTGNAIKFSPEGGIVRLGVDRNDDGVHFRVEDQGRGIPADKLESIFGRFSQVEPADAGEKGGAGLGLAISRAIVQQHGGRIWAESEWGHGSVFHLRLPPDPRTGALQDRSM